MTNITGIKAKIMSKTLEKMIKKNTGKYVIINLKNARIETHGNTVEIVIEARGTVDKKDFESVAPFLGI